MVRLAAYPAFLASLLLPGLGQALTGAPARGVALFLLAAGFALAVAAGRVQLPAAGGIPPRDALACGGAFLLWAFAPYDAWFRGREAVNGMLPLLPRTPRVAAVADLLWGGAGALYLGRRRGGPAALVTLGLVTVLDTWLLLGLLAVWNAGWAVASYRWAAARYHGATAYRALHARLSLAPLTSPLAPSPSLPLATLVAAFIALLGGLLMARALGDLEQPARAAVVAAGTVRDGRFVDDLHGLALDLPAGGWSFATGRPPALLTGHHRGRDLSFSLALAARPLFAAGDVVPTWALERFARRQEKELAASLEGFQVSAYRPMPGRTPPGLRLVFTSRTAGAPVRTVQDYLLDRDRVLILTLAAPDDGRENDPAAELDRLAAGLRTMP